MRRDYFVYYHVHKRDAELALEHARAILASVATACGVAGRLARRAEDPLTWMEIYENVGDATAFESALRNAEHSWIPDTPRQRECFVGD